MEQIKLITLLNMLYGFNKIEVWTKESGTIYEGKVKDFPFEYFDYLSSLVSQLNIDDGLLQITLLSEEETEDLYEGLFKRQPSTIYGDMRNKEG